MAKTVALEGRTLAWARAEFARYYASVHVEPPSRFARREFAWFPFGGETAMRRHLALRSVEEFHHLLERDVPRHVYYSSAYYRIPDHPKMDGKEWLGADVIFDLDADHLRQAAGRDYAGQLALVKEKVAALLDDFLFGDFGVSPEATRLVFSGGRGYHVHLLDEKFLGLTSPERRELVEYIEGSGFDPADAVRASRGPAAPDAEEGLRPRGPGRAFKSLYPPDAPGWRGRTSRSVVRLLSRWESAGADSAAEELERAGVTRGKARHLARLLVTGGKAAAIRESLSLDVFPREIPRELLEVVLRQAAIEVQGETDAPVTTDIHRLIRLPGSLHGGTGFRVVPLTRERLNAFDPFRDARIPARTDEVSVGLTDRVDYPFPDGPVRGDAGDVVSLPVAEALFLTLRGQAELRPGSGP